MQEFHLPFVSLPAEFVTLLKSNISVTNSPAPIFDVIRPNTALWSVLSRAFNEFDDGRGLEKVMLALGWPAFRERMASVFLFKSIYGDYPSRTSMEIVEDLRDFEGKFSQHAVQSFSRLFMLGFYIKMANLQLQRQTDNIFLEIKLSSDVEKLLDLSQARSERIDWVILLIAHYERLLGAKTVANTLVAGKKFDDLYEMLSSESRSLMHKNLLSYGASIQESEVFIYEKV